MNGEKEAFDLFVFGYVSHLFNATSGSKYPFLQTLSSLDRATGRHYISLV